MIHVCSSVVCVVSTELYGSTTTEEDEFEAWGIRKFELQLLAGVCQEDLLRAGRMTWATKRLTYVKYQVISHFKNNKYSKADFTRSESKVNVVNRQRVNVSTVARPSCSGRNHPQELSAPTSRCPCSITRRRTKSAPSQDGPTKATIRRRGSAIRRMSLECHLDSLTIL